MTKNELVDRIADRMQRTKKEAEEVLENVLSTIAEVLERGERVDLRGFGSFQVNAKSERQGRHPRTGEAMTIAARNVAVFKPSKELSDRVNQAVATTGKLDVASAQEQDAEAVPRMESAKVHDDKIS